MLPVKRAIMILLSLMVGLVLVVSWLMASANLEFAEKAMAQLRQRQSSVLAALLAGVCLLSHGMLSGVEPAG